MHARIDIYVKKQVGNRYLFKYEDCTRMCKNLKEAKEKFCRWSGIDPRMVKCKFSDAGAGVNAWGTLRKI